MCGIGRWANRCANGAAWVGGVAVGAAGGADLRQRDGSTRRACGWAVRACVDVVVGVAGAADEV